MDRNHACMYVCVCMSTHHACMVLCVSGLVRLLAPLCVCVYICISFFKEERHESVLISLKKEEVHYIRFNRPENKKLMKLANRVMLHLLSTY